MCKLNLCPLDVHCQQQNVASIQRKLRVKGQKLLGKIIELQMQVQNIGTTTTCNSPLNNPKSITVLQVLTPFVGDSSD
jgi:hypothetical protein